MKNCPNCGTTIAKEGATACPVCGAKLPAIEREKAAPLPPPPPDDATGGGGGQAVDGGGRSFKPKPGAPWKAIALVGVGSAAIVAVAVAVYFVMRDHRPPAPGLDGGAERAGRALHDRPQGDGARSGPPLPDARPACVASCMSCFGDTGALCQMVCADDALVLCHAEHRMCDGLSLCALRQAYGPGAAMGTKGCRETMQCLKDCGADTACDARCVAGAKNAFPLQPAMACVISSGSYDVCAARSPFYQQCMAQ